MARFFNKLGKKEQDKQPESQDTQWDDLKAVEFSSETENIDPEKANAERQQRKITAYLLYHKNPDYIFAPDVTLNPGDEDRLSEQLASGTITRDDELGILTRIEDPIGKSGKDQVFSKLSHSKHFLRILSYNTKSGFENWQQTSPDNLAEFIKKFPTPMDFEAASQIFLDDIKRSNPNKPEKYTEYLADMESFRKIVYGKRQEYWEQIQKLEAKASAWQQQEAIEKPQDKSEFGETLVKEFGYYEMSKAQAKIGMIANNPGERLPEDYTEDAHLEMPEQGLFAVFDGAGGHVGARAASQSAVNTVRDLATKFNLEHQGNLAWALNEASRAIESNPEAGMSTAVIAKVIEANGAKKLAFASVGDSRIYIVRENSFALLITKDEGEGKFITNALGRIPNQESHSRVKQLGLVDLWPGDRVVLCSDGVTGDKPEELMSDDQIAATVGLAWNTQQAATELVEGARKKDDRTAIVFQV
ncbi:MAG: protein phosphatase 2C domain-containing protein [Candidatus Nomurabacteria bacterium]|jgi:serine/threonine protein phosphatase PrpC|nr:protein phosphatase 2C domain-containing protein [Candidatus Nomurabacteria bacterium]